MLSYDLCRICSWSCSNRGRSVRNRCANAPTAADSSHPTRRADSIDMRRALQRHRTHDSCSPQRGAEMPCTNCSCWVAHPLPLLPFRIRVRQLGRLVRGPRHIKDRQVCRCHDIMHVCLSSLVTGVHAATLHAAVLAAVCRSTPGSPPRASVRPMPLVQSVSSAAAVSQAQIAEQTRMT